MGMSVRITRAVELPDMTKTPVEHRSKRQIERSSGKKGSTKSHQSSW